MPEHQRDIEQEIADFTSDDFQRFSERLTEQLDTMPKGLRTAARFVLSHPVDVALSSMRRQAKQVGVSHSTMVRLAEWMGLDGYDALRAIFREGIKAGTWTGTEGSAGTDWGQQRSSDNLEWLAAEVERCGLQDRIQHYGEAATILADADRVICVTSEAELTVAHRFGDLMQAIGRKAVSFDSATGAPTEIKSLGPRDAMLAVCMGNSIPQVTSTARYAGRRGARIVSITNCPASSIARFSHAIILPSQISESTPMLAVTIASVEIIASLMVDPGIAL